MLSKIYNLLVKVRRFAPYLKYKNKFNIFTVFIFFKFYLYIRACNKSPPYLLKRPPRE